MQGENGIRTRAAELERLRADLDRLFAARDGSEQSERAWSAAANAFKEAWRSFYQPFDDLGPGIRQGD